MDSLEAALQAAIDANDPDTILEVGALMDAADTATRARLEQPGALRAAALYYATVRHWSVFPCRPGEKRPATLNGLHDGTTDERKITAWWTWNPNYNIGLPTGIHFDVIDIDGHTGMDSLLQWCREADTTSDALFAPRLGSVLTPRRPGTHIYTAPTTTGNKAGMRPGIDWRGAGGYVLAPPSRTEHGMYVWATPVVPEDAA